MSFKIASWNVNSLRIRLPQVIDWLAKEKPDVLAIQETKVLDDLFPLQALQETGYQVVFNGQKTYNGVALLSKHPLTDITKTLPHLNPDEKRVLGASLGKLRIWNVYVPNGESLTSDKYRHKLAWLDHINAFFAQELLTYPELIVLGDFNIAPEPCDVHGHLLRKGSGLVSHPERTKLHSLFELGLKDCYRLHHPDSKTFSWWDYRLNAFKRNLGLRIDLILSSQAMASKCLSSDIDKTARGAERPSDHAPVIAEFDF
ncbi:MAG TPA: exodeoxyribonuclease III [Gammaproteobacteria bacterium]|nr:exodeoxyribonuclease III [Gammaproteobacteria bacterium]